MSYLAHIIYQDNNEDWCKTKTYAEAKEFIDSGVKGEPDVLFQARIFSLSNFDMWLFTGADYRNEP
jgi:hypothetical protein